MQESPAPVDLSIRIYNRLLAVYPGAFRAEYGHHMTQVFRDVCRRDYSRGGLPGMASLWARTSLDLLRTTVEEHTEKGIDMRRETFVRWSGWALMAGALIFAAGLILGSFDSYDMDPIGGVDAFYEISQAVGLGLGQILFVIGLLGLRAGYGARSGTLGSGLLALAIAGGVVSLAGMGMMSSIESGWTVWMGGFLAMTLTLAVFGVVAIRRRVFSSWNFAPLLAGLGIPLLFGIGVVGVEAVSGAAPEWASLAAVVTTATGLILVGYRMQAEASGVEAAA